MINNTLSFFIEEYSFYLNSSSVEHNISNEAWKFSFNYLTKYTVTDKDRNKMCLKSS